MKIEIAIVLLAVIATFGSVVPDYYPVADDIGKRALLNRVDEANDSLSGKLAAAFWRAEFRGHFRPIQDCVYVACFHYAGDDGYGVPLSATYMLMHCGSALLLMAILRRLGMRRAPALLAGVLFALHPTFDENIACIQFGNNIGGVFWVLATAWCLLPAQSVRAGRLKLAGAGVSIFVAIGFGINLAVTAAILAPVVLFMTLQRKGESTSRWWWLKPLIPPGIVGVVSAVLAFWLRLHAYGELKTKQTVYEDLVPNRDPARLFEQFVDSTILLKPAGTRRIFLAQSPSGETLADFRQELFTLDGVLCALLALAAAAAAIFVSRSDRTESRPMRGFVFGLTYLVAALFPYVYFLGRLGPNRYTYTGIPGLVILVVALFAVVAAPFRKAVKPDVLIAVLCVPVLFLCARTGREAARSIVEGQNITRTVVEGTVAAVDEDPGVSRIYALGYPRVVGRAGYTLTFISQLRAYTRQRLGRFIEHSKTNFYADLHDGLLGPEELGPQTAIFGYGADGSYGRVSYVGHLLGTPAGQPEALRELRFHWKVLPGVSPKLVKQLAESPSHKTTALISILDELEGGERADHVGKALMRIFAGRGKPPKSGCPGLATPGGLAQALNFLNKYDALDDVAPVVTMAASLRHRSPGLSAAVLEILRGMDDTERRLELAFAFALSADRDEDVEAAIALVDSDGSFREALSAERTLIDTMLGTSPDLDLATTSFRTARRGYSGVSIDRGAPGRFAAGSELALLSDDDLATERERLQREGPKWKADVAKSIQEGRKSSRVDLRLAMPAARTPGAADETIAVVISSRSKRPLRVRGFGRTDPWLQWEWVRDADGVVAARGVQPLAGADIPRRGERMTPLYVPMAGLEGPGRLIVRVLAFGRELAVAEAPFEVVK